MVLVCDTQVAGHELDKSKNGHYYYGVGHKFYAWMHQSGPAGPDTQPQASQVLQPACSAKCRGHIPIKCAKQGQSNPLCVADHLTRD